MRDGKAARGSPFTSAIHATRVLGALGRVRARLGEKAAAAKAEEKPDEGRRGSIEGLAKNRRISFGSDDEPVVSPHRRVSLGFEGRRGSAFDLVAGSASLLVPANPSQARGHSMMSRRSSFAGSAGSSIAPSMMQDTVKDSNIELYYQSAVAATPLFLETMDTSSASVDEKPGTPAPGPPRPKTNAMALFARLPTSQRAAESSKFGLHVRKLMAEVSATRELPRSILAKTPDVVGFMSCPHGTVLFEEGSDPDCCFIVLQGRVQFWRQGPECDVPFPADEGNSSARKHSATIAMMLTKLGGKKEGQQDRAGTPDGKQRGNTLAGQSQGLSALSGYIVSSCGPGTLLGDAELLVYQPRLATAVVCSDSCEMLVLARSDFDSLMKSAMLKAEVRRVALPIKQMLMQFPFFQRLEPDVQASVAEVMHFGYQRKGEIVFRQGDPPGQCYIILQGEVGIWVNGLEELGSPPARPPGSPSPSTPGSSSPTVSPKARPSLIRQTTASFLLANRDPEGPMGDVVKRAQPMPNRDTGNQASRQKCHAILSSLSRLHSLKCAAAEVDGPVSADECIEELAYSAKQVAWLGPGKMFGELALLEDQPRSATVTCMEDCAFLTIEGSDFDRVLKKAMNEAVMSLPILAEPLLKELPFFQKLRQAVQQRVRHIVNYRTAKRGTVIFWQADAPERCYVLLSGQVSCWRHCDADAPTSSYDGRGMELPPESVSEKCAQLASRLSQIEQREDSIEEHSRRLSDAVYGKLGTRRPMQRRGSMTEVMGMPVAVLREGAVFGEQSLMMESAREVTITCDKDCQLLYIEKVQFDRVVKEDVIRAKVQELQMQVKRLFRGFPLFEDLGRNVQDTVPEIARYSFEPVGSVLFREGDHAELCYILLSGEVTIWKADQGQASLDLSAVRGAIADSPKKGGGGESSTGRSGSSSPSKEREAPAAAAEGSGPAAQDAKKAGQPKGLGVPQISVQRGSAFLVQEAAKAAPAGAIAQQEDEVDDDEEEEDEVAEPGAPSARGGGKDTGLAEPGAAGKKSGGKEPSLPSLHERQASKASATSNFGEESDDEEHIPVEKSFAPAKKEEKPAVPRPPLSKPHPDAYERCMQLAAKLEPVSRCLRAGKRAPGEPEEEQDRPGETVVACLGPGSLFGEWALLNNDPRSATVTCHTDCEFLVIEKCDFDRVVKQEMAVKKQEKLEFLQTYVPGIKQLTGRKMEEMLSCFERKTVPWNHVFLEQGQVADGSVYFVWRGSVEFYASSSAQTSGPSSGLDMSQKGFQRLRVLIKGGVFGSLPLKARLPVTAIARSSPCEVLQVSMERLKQLPEVVFRGVRKLLDQTSAWHPEGASVFPSASATGSSSPSRAMSRGATSGGRRPGEVSLGSSSGAALPSLQSQAPRPQSSKIPRPLSGKIPRPLDGKFPGLLGPKGALHHTASSPTLGKGSPSPAFAQTWSGGLFKREREAEIDMDLMDSLDVQPGEVLALRAHRPKRKDEMVSAVLRSPMHGTRGKLVSLPSMHGQPKR